MEESSVYRSIFAEGKDRGVTETQRSIALNLLQRHFARSRTIA
jgi:hypothetical protein